MYFNIFNSTSSSPSVLNPATLLPIKTTMRYQHPFLEDCFEVKLRHRKHVGVFGIFLGGFTGNKTWQRRGWYQLSGDVVQRSRYSKLYRTYYLKCREIHHVHQGSQDVCFRWLPVVQMHGWKKILSFWDGATLGRCYVKYWGSTTFHFISQKGWY